MRIDQQQKQRLMLTCPKMLLHNGKMEELGCQNLIKTKSHGLWEIYFQASMLFNMWCAFGRKQLIELVLKRCHHALTHKYNFINETENHLSKRIYSLNCPWNTKSTSIALIYFVKVSLWISLYSPS